jgi:ribosomal protein L37AE/L43A
LFDKSLSIPIPLQQIEAFLRRIPKEHPIRPIAEEKARILRSGYNGEKNLNYFLSLLPEKDYRIFHNIRLPSGTSHFQIDFLLISPKLIIILDSKNHLGTLIFEKKQLIQISNDSEKIYPNPLSQVYRHKFLLKKFLESHQIPNIPIEYHVVVTNPSTKVVISQGYEEAEKRVWKVEDLLIKMDVMEKTFNKEWFDKRNISKTKKVILQNDTPERCDFIKIFNMKQSEILPGVQCPKCLSLPMNYKGRLKWECSSCKYISKDAYYQAIQDFFLLIKPSITHSELKNFLHLPNDRTVTYIPSSLNLSFSGKTKDRMYYQNSTNHVYPTSS